MQPPLPAISEERPFVGRYNPWVGGPLLLVGLLCLGLNLWVMLLAGDFNGGIVVGIVVSVAGFLYLTRPCFSLAPNRLTLYSPIGAVIKRYPYGSITDIKVDNNKVYIAAADRRSPQEKEKVKLAKWMVQPQDWQMLRQLTLG